MKIERLVKNPPQWLSASGPESGNVLSSRVRLARNFREKKFTHLLTPSEKKEQLEKVSGKMLEEKLFKNPFFFDLEVEKPVVRNVLVERHIISFDLANSGGARGCLVSGSEKSGVMINEEDHLRMQVIMSGFQLKEAFREAEELDKKTAGLFDYAFSERFGYLTACPTNVGTGLRASVLVHLPALVLTRSISKVFNGILKIGFSVRGFYGEGTEALGNIFQISNQNTLGKNEDTIVDMIDRITVQLLNYEKDARDFLMKDARVKTEDTVYRALGILENARTLSSREFMEHFSSIKLGASLGFFKSLKIQDLNEMLVLAQVGHLQKLNGCEMDETERDFVRARMVRETLKYTGE
ncbi:MAG: protein arginine kinase [Fibrobacterota bacterium]